MFKIKFRQNKIKFRTEPQPSRAWSRLMIIFLVFVTAVFIAGYLLYRRLETIEFVSQRRLQAENAKIVHLDLDALKMVRAWLAERTPIVLPAGIEPTSTP